MASLDLAGRVVLEAWTGPIAAGDVEEIEARLEHFGSAYGVALQMLLTKRAQFSVTAADRSSGDDRTNHAVNLKALDEQIQGLVAAMGSLETYTPSQAEMDLMLLATAAPGQATTTIDLVTSSPRRG